MVNAAFFVTGEQIENVRACLAIVLDLSRECDLCCVSDWFSIFDCLL
jgi:hypothetical protein